MHAIPANWSHCLIRMFDGKNKKKIGNPTRYETISFCLFFVSFSLVVVSLLSTARRSHRSRRRRSVKAKSTFRKAGLSLDGMAGPPGEVFQSITSRVCVYVHGGEESAE